MHPRKLVRDSINVALSSYLARAGLLLRGVISAAALGPRGYGSWNALNLILDYGTYASCGALQGLDLELPPAVASRPAAAARLLAGAWSMVLLGAGIFSIAVLAFVGFQGLAAPDGIGWTAPLLMLAAVWLQLAIQVLGSWLKARGEFGVVSLATTIQVAIGAGAGIALVWRFGIPGLLSGWLAGTIAALALLRRRVDVPLRLAPLADGWALARAGLPVFAFFAASLVLRSVDRLALLRFGGATPLGHYSLGLMAVGLVLYVPESAAAVLYPRVAAAAKGRGARADAAWARARLDVVRAQRALAIALPPFVALAMVWAAPVTAIVLPAFGPGVPALRFLVAGALLMSAGTVPGYFLLASGRAPRLLAVGAAAAAWNAALVFAVAAVAPRPAAVAAASATGYAAFGFGMALLAGGDLLDSAGERRGFLTASFVPALWAAALALAAVSVGPTDSWWAVLGRSAAVVVGYLPALWWFGRGVGLKRLAREWLLARPIPA